jgi:hypothetical protein
MNNVGLDVLIRVRQNDRRRKMRGYIPPLPIQDVLLVSVEQFAHQRPHAVLTIGDNTQLGLKVLSALS